MADSTNWLEYGKLLAAVAFGGFGGAALNYFIAESKNSIQPVGKKVTISYVDLPTVLQGYDASITLKAKGSEPAVEPVYFQKLAVIRFEFVNSGNKDLDTFDIGINFPEGTEAIGFNSEGDDRYHKATCQQEVSIESRAKELDVQLKPFHKGNRYTLTTIANVDRKISADDIELSKLTPVKFVDLDNSAELRDLYRKLLETLIPLIVATAAATSLGSEIISSIFK